MSELPPVFWYRVWFVLGVIIGIYGYIAIDGILSLIADEREEEAGQRSAGGLKK